MGIHEVVETIQVVGSKLVDLVQGLVHEGNVQRIIIKDEHGRTFIEIPITVAVIGAVLAPILAAVGAISAVAAKFTVVVQRSAVENPTPTKL